MHPCIWVHSYLFHGGTQAYSIRNIVDPACKHTHCTAAGGWYGRGGDVDHAEPAAREGARRRGPTGGRAWAVLARPAGSLLPW